MVGENFEIYVILMTGKKKFMKLPTPTPISNPPPPPTNLHKKVCPSTKRFFLEKIPPQTLGGRHHVD